MILGIDPDLTTTAWASIELDGTVSGAGVIEIKSLGRGHENETALEMIREIRRSQDLPSGIGYDVVVVEGQELYAGKTPNPRSILALGWVAGALASWFSDRPTLLMPSPQAWKGSTEKQIHHGRICRRLGWAYEKHGNRKTGYCSPVGTEDAPSLRKRSLWKHAMDAIGLGLYGLDIHEHGSRNKAKAARGRVA